MLSLIYSILVGPNSYTMAVTGLPFDQYYSTIIPVICWEQVGCILAIVCGSYYECVCLYRGGTGARTNQATVGVAPISEKGNQYLHGPIIYSLFPWQLPLLTAT